METTRPRKMRPKVLIKPADSHTLPMETQTLPMQPSTPPGRTIPHVSHDQRTPRRTLSLETQPSTPPGQDIPVIQHVSQDQHSIKLEPTVELRRFEIGTNRFLIHSLYRGDDKIHIRQFNPYPTKIGICFSPLRLAAFRVKLSEIEEGVKLLRAGKPVNLKIHIGGLVYVTIQSGYFIVNIRKYFIPENQIDEIPTRSGIALKLNEWDKLKQCFVELLRLTPEIASIQPCYSSFDHANVITMMDCEECNPLVSWMHNKD
jgi:hypothetical protein